MVDQQSKRPLLRATEQQSSKAAGNYGRNYSFENCCSAAVLRYCFISAVLLLFCTTALLLYSCSRQPVYPSPVILNDYASVEVNHLKEKVPEFFSYNFNGKRINFFVIKINGRVLSFLDACSTCYPKKSGFRYGDGYISCRDCDVSYHVEDIEKGVGSCIPIKILGEEKEGRYLISLRALEERADKF